MRPLSGLWHSPAPVPLGRWAGGGYPWGWDLTVCISSCGPILPDLSRRGGEQIAVTAGIYNCDELIEELGGARGGGRHVSAVDGTESIGSRRVQDRWLQRQPRCPEPRPG